jgi:hypothetical protein
MSFPKHNTQQLGQQLVAQIMLNHHKKSAFKNFLAKAFRGVSCARNCVLVSAKFLTHEPDDGFAAKTPRAK